MCSLFATAVVQLVEQSTNDPKIQGSNRGTVGALLERTDLSFMNSVTGYSKVLRYPTG